MKTSKIIYWISTIVIFLFDAAMPALTSHLPLAVESIRHLGYPDYFRVQLTIFKVIGGLLLILPKVPARLKEWAYVGFAINYISASVAHANVDGFGFFVVIPFIILGILIVSYLLYHKLNDKQLTIA
ncbi:MAG: DoxX family protein [Bacteroidetes bacterium]|nr:DoxX family protein [Bacteroidota bacterium]MBI3482104.1 DoxX family protein [Bacteroidota bacterium]